MRTHVRTRGCVFATAAIAAKRFIGFLPQTPAEPRPRGEEAHFNRRTPLPDLPDINQEFETRRIIRSAVLQDASAFVEQAGGKRAFLYDTPLGQLEAFHARVERTLRDAHAVAGDASTAFDATEQIKQIGGELRGEIAV